MNRRKIILFIAILAGGYMAKGQVFVKDVEKKEVFDTIYVNDGTSYLIFNHDIYAFGLGDEINYTGIAYKNSLQIRSRSRQKKVSSVFLTYGDSTYRQYYYAIVKYDPNSMKEFYDNRADFYKNVGSRNTQRIKEYYNNEDQENTFISELKTRSGLIKNFGDEIFDLGTTANDIQANLRLVRTDNNYAYLKFLFINKSSVDYVFDKVSFQYVQKYNMGLFKKRKEKFVEVFPLVVNADDRVKGHGEKVLVYIIPTFGIKKGEKLLITFREKSGGRNIPFELQSDVIMKATILEERRK